MLMDGIAGGGLHVPAAASRKARLFGRGIGKPLSPYKPRSSIFAVAFSICAATVVINSCCLCKCFAKAPLTHVGCSFGIAFGSAASTSAGTKLPSGESDISPMSASPFLFFSASSGFPCPSTARTSRMSSPLWSTPAAKKVQRLALESRACVRAARTLDRFHKSFNWAAGISGTTIQISCGFKRAATGKVAKPARRSVFDTHTDWYLNFRIKLWANSKTEEDLSSPSRTWP
mmetsp:Transcript_41510/g.119765  ORF Transcript_41510/g.119765 Transcript_41510/m.119765 type:complete len:231 (+) Transcript_41510:163-855(+)